MRKEKTTRLQGQHALLVVLVAVTNLPPLAARLQNVLPHNLTHCLLEARPLSLCAWFDAFNTTGCDDGASHTAFRCLNESRCVAVYDVPTCVRAFNYTRDQFNYTACVALVESLNASLGGNLSLSNGTGCEVLVVRDDEAAADEDGSFNASSGPPPPPRLPRFHPCAGALDTERVVAIRDVMRRAESYTSHVVVALDPHIGPVAGGVSVGVCGLGFTQTNEAVAHLYCRFTDGRYHVEVPAQHVDAHQVRCIAPDFTRFAVGMPHNVSVELSTGRGAAWTDNRVPFTYCARGRARTAATREARTGAGAPPRTTRACGRARARASSLPSRSRRGRLDAAVHRRLRPAHVGVRPHVHALGVAGRV